MDALGRNALQLAYNPDGWITNRWTPEKGNTAYSYDNIGNILTIVYSDFTNKYAYDAINELTNMTDRVGTTAFSYTPMGQLQSETGPWPSDAVSYVYNQERRTDLTLTEPSGSWSQDYSYDSGWRMTNVSSPAGAFGYSYNLRPASTLVSGITLPDGAGIANQYDSLARLTGTILTNHWGHILDGYTYIPDPLGLRTNILRNLGLISSSVSVGYDNIGQLISWFAKETNGISRQNEQLSFGFDSADNLHFRTNGVMGQTFTVDAANQLTNFSRAGTFTVSGAILAPATNITVNGITAQTYGDFTFAATNLSLSDGNNNFTSIARNVYGVTVTNTFSVNLPSSVMLSYDNNGNLTNDGTRAFNYDSENRLTNVAVSGQWRSDFVYDGLGRRRIVREYAWNGSWLKTNEIRIVYDSYLPIQERDSNNNVVVTYTRGLDFSGSVHGAGGIGGLLARTDANGSTFYHSDGAGNVTALMDGQEDIVARYMYGPFGKPIGQWGSMAGANEMQFSSMPRDSLSGLSFYPFRAYEPNLQRWQNQDPIQEQGGINLYRFNFNNPMRWIDAFGLFGMGDVLVADQQDLANETYSPADVSAIYNPGEPILGPMNAEEDARMDAQMEQANDDLDQALMQAEVQLAMLPNPEFDAAEYLNAMKNLAKLGAKSKCPTKAPKYKDVEAFLDSTGKVHGDLPNPNELREYDPEQLSKLRDELEQSVQQRIQKTSDLGSNPTHDWRQAQEQQLIQAINRQLEQ